MRRTLSARHTALLKSVLPPIWIGLVGSAAWLLWSNPDVLLEGEAGATRLVTLELHTAAPLGRRVTFIPAGPP